MTPKMLPCPNRSCVGGEIWSEAAWDFDGTCQTCHGYAFVWEDGTPIDSKPERADPLEFTTPDGDWPDGDAHSQS